MFDFGLQNHFAIQLVMFSWPIFLSQIAGCPAAGTSHTL
jgi:hypothetical protein